MKLTTKQLKQIVAEELRSVLDEVLVDPMDLAQIALQDPQVDEKIKVLLRDPNNRNYGIQLLTLMYPDDYPAEAAESYEASDEYKKTFDKELQFHKDTATMETAYSIIESHPKIKGEITDYDGRASFRSDDKEAMLAAMADFEKQFPEGGFYEFSTDEEDKRLASDYGLYFAIFQLTEKPTKTPRSFEDIYKNYAHIAKDFVLQRRHGDDYYKFSGTSNETDN